MDNQMKTDLLEREQVNSYNKFLIQKYNKYTDFKALVDRLIINEKNNSGHCGSVQDAAKLANLVVYNKFFNDHFKKNKNK